MRKLFHRWFLVAAIVSLTPVLLFAGGGKEEPVTVEAGSRFVQVDDQWSFSWRFLDDEIEFTVSAPTTGWVAIGFNPSRMMKDADYILAYVADGQLHVRDDYGTGNTSHGPDESVGGSQHVRPIEGVETDGVTTAVFAVPLDSNDEYDEVFIQGTTYTVLLAYGGDNADNFTGMHRSRTSLEVQLD